MVGQSVHPRLSSLAGGWAGGNGLFVVYECLLVAVTCESLNVGTHTVGTWRCEHASVLCGSFYVPYINLHLFIHPLSQRRSVCLRG